MPQPAAPHFPLSAPNTALRLWPAPESSVSCPLVMAVTCPPRGPGLHEDAHVAGAWCPHWGEAGPLVARGRALARTCGSSACSTHSRLGASGCASPSPCAGSGPGRCARGPYARVYAWKQPLSGGARRQPGSRISWGPVSSANSSRREVPSPAPAATPRTTARRGSERRVGPRGPTVWPTHQPGCVGGRSLEQQIGVVLR